ncbi:MAG TPA: hypothetical protein VKF38_01145 [Anaerolineaceae bacterium]|nr:hypothetical protein [Anaerolineaceae bacterium]
MATFQNRSIMNYRLALKSFLENQAIQKIFRLVFILGLSFFAIWFFNYAITIITTPVPVEFREGAILLSTNYLLHGINPYSLINQPLGMNVYGIVYNFVVLPFAAIFGNTLAVHRTISIVCLVLTGIIITQWLLLKGTAPEFAISGGFIVFGSLLFNLIPITRPDALGVLLFLSAIFLPEKYKFNSKSLIASSILSMLAFYTKPYFFLSFGIIFSYLFFFISKKKGLFYFLGSLPLFLITAGFVNLICECYFLDTILINLNNTGNNIQFVLMQLLYFIIVYLPIWIIILLIAFYNQSRQVLVPFQIFIKALRTPGKHLDIFHWNRPFFSFRIDLAWFSFAISTLAIILVLGQNLNNYIVYLFEIMTPFLIIAGFKHLNLKRSISILAIPLVITNLFIISQWVLNPNNPESFQIGWSRLEEIISSSNKILNSPAIAPLLIQMDKPIIDSGQSDLFYQTRPYPKTILAPAYNTVKQRGIDYQNQIISEINAKRFEKIIVTIDNSHLVPWAAIQQKYQYQETISLGMPQTGQVWNVEVWIPKN